MQYRIIRTKPPTDAIEHGLFGNHKGGAKLGSTWDNHLYIARQKTATGWRYFYNQAELRAAQAKQSGQQLTKKAASTVKTGAATVKRAVQNAPSNARSTASSVRNSIKNASVGIRSGLSSAKKTAENTVNSVRSAASDKAAKAKNVLSGQYAKDVNKRLNDSHTITEGTYAGDKKCIQ